MGSWFWWLCLQMVLQLVVVVQVVLVSNLAGFGSLFAPVQWVRIRVPAAPNVKLS
jgi:hypothetical protein